MSSPGKSIANIKLWLLKTYLKDLEEHKAGDVRRFDRMVDGKGNSCGSEGDWKAKVKALVVDSYIVTHCPTDLIACQERAKSLGIEVKS